MSESTQLMSTNKPYTVQVTAGIDGNNQPYFLYSDVNGQPLRSPIKLPAVSPAYDSVRYVQVGAKTELRLWAAVTHTLNNSAPVPQGDNLLLAPQQTVSISVGCGTWRGTVLVFEQLNAAGQVVELVPTPDPVTENEG